MIISLVPCGAQGGRGPAAGGRGCDALGWERREVGRRRLRLVYGSTAFVATAPPCVSAALAITILPLPRVSAAFVAKALPLPCGFTAFAASYKALPLPCVTTASTAKTAPLPCAFPQPSQLRHCRCPCMIPVPSRLRHCLCRFAIAPQGRGVPRPDRGLQRQGVQAAHATRGTQRDDPTAVSSTCMLKRGSPARSCRSRHHRDDQAP